MLFKNGFREGMLEIHEQKWAGRGYENSYPCPQIGGFRSIYKLFQIQKMFGKYSNL